MLKNSRPGISSALYGDGVAAEQEKFGWPSERGLTYLEAAGGVLFLILVYAVGVHLQGHLVVAASDLAVGSLTPHAQHPVEVGGAEHLLTELQQPHDRERTAPPMLKNSVHSRSAPPRHLSTHRLFPAQKALVVASQAVHRGRGRRALRQPQSGLDLAHENTALCVRGAPSLLERKDANPASHASTPSFPEICLQDSYTAHSMTHENSNFPIESGYSGWQGYLARPDDPQHRTHLVVF